MSPPPSEVLNWALTLSNYPILLAGSLALSLALIFGLQANRMSAAAFGFSMLFALIWMGAATELFFSIPLEWHSSHTLAVVALAAAMSFIFAAPAFVTMLSLGVRPSDVERRRIVIYAVWLLLGHALHLYICATISALSQS